MVSREGFHDLREVLMSSGRIGLDQVLVQHEVDEADLAAVPFLARYSDRTFRHHRGSGGGWPNAI